MKWFLFLMTALIGTCLGIMFSEGAVQHGWQIAFFVVLIASFFSLTWDVSKS